MPSSEPPNWGLPQAAASIVHGSTWDRSSGGFFGADGALRFLRLTALSTFPSAVVVGALSDPEAAGVPYPVLPVVDQATATILINGTWSTTKLTVVYQGVGYNIAAQRIGGQDVAVAIAIR